MQILSIALTVIILAALGLILFTAPMKYSTFEKNVFIAGGALFFLLAVWNGGVRLTWARMMPFVVPGKLDAARAAVGSLQVPPYWELAAALFFGVYWFYVHIRRAARKLKNS